MIRLYPQVSIKGKSFEKSKVHVLPNQSMSLREIITRFVRRQAIPSTTNDAFYSIEYGDIEKFRTLDFTEQEERIAQVSEIAKNLLKREKEELELQKQLAVKKELEKQKASSPNSGTNGETRAERPAGDGAGGAAKS